MKYKKRFIPPFEMWNDFLTFRAEMFAHFDTMLYGEGKVLKINRKWWNPLRYLMGEEKVTCIRYGKDRK